MDGFLTWAVGSFEVNCFSEYLINYLSTCAVAILYVAK
jgi:hypothetical protein